LLGLGPIRWVDVYMGARRRAAGRLEVDLRPDQPLAPVLAILESRRAKVERIQLEEAGDEGRELRLEVVLPASVSGREVVEHLSKLDEVLAVRWDESRATAPECPR